MLQIYGNKYMNGKYCLVDFFKRNRKNRKHNKLQPFSEQFVAFFIRNCSCYAEEITDFCLINYKLCLNVIILLTKHFVA